MKILIVDDHALCRTGMHFMLNGLMPELQVLESAGVRTALDLVVTHPDISLCFVDLTLPGESGMDLVTILCRDYPGIATVVVSAHEDTDTIVHAMQCGARGYIPKAVSQAIMESAINLVLAGGCYLPSHLLNVCLPEPTQQDIAEEAAIPELTPRQIAVLQCLLQGLPTKSISRQLCLSENTVKTHLAAVYRSLKVTTRSQAVIAAGRLGIRTDVSGIPPALARR